MEEFIDTLQMVLRDKKETLGFRKEEKQDPALAAKAWPLKTELDIRAEKERLDEEQRRGYKLPAPDIDKEGEAITADEVVRVVTDKDYQDEVVSEFIKEAEPVVKKIQEQEQAEALQRATEAVRLIRIDFDNMENRDPYCEEEVAVFVGDAHLTAHGKASEYMRTMEKVRPYAGYDGQVYPQFKLKKVKLNPDGKGKS